MVAEHRGPLAGFVLVLAAACLIMGNGLRQQVVEILVDSGTSRALIAAVAPDMVLGRSLRDLPPAPSREPEQSSTAEGPVSSAPQVPQIEMEGSTGATAGTSTTPRPDRPAAGTPRADPPARGDGSTVVAPRTQSVEAPAAPAAPAVPATPPMTVPDRQSTVVAPSSRPSGGVTGSVPNGNGAGTDDNDTHGKPGKGIAKPAQPGHVPDRAHGRAGGDRDREDRREDRVDRRGDRVDRSDRREDRQRSDRSSRSARDRSDRGHRP